MKITVSTVSDRRLAGVWRWYAIEHVRNHPRWDPDMELEQISEARSALESGDATATVDVYSHRSREWSCFAAARIHGLLKRREAPLVATL